ncbi:putative RNA methyltransferase [Arthrobacter glacialis]|uniref:SAM-dependent methyltransferase n=1 Tax=Arthrobacter glacialis TaxID=1664 RepID=A0A2S3ZS26_ARTGL|nr:methyltransferase domain-containing protein [Arthrobacter glacialis]POH71914.1 SAM-dependent methyltransferase [Arthrobacter glacialis]
MEPCVVEALLCPHCGLEYIVPQPGANSVVCVEGHSFDVARQGYLNLLTGHGTKFLPDTAAMVNARDAFLDAGHYQGLSDALARQVEAALPPTETALLVDAGTGTGYYLQQVLGFLGARSNEAVAGPEHRDSRRVDAVGLDISKFALRRAARRNPRAANIVWDLWRALPLGANTADVVLVIFAPRNASEFARILKPGGSLIVVTPLPAHLAEIAKIAGLLAIQEEKEAALVHSMASHFSLVSSHEVLCPLELSPADVGNVALMGPAGHHLDPVALGQQLAQLPELTAATAAFRISVFAPTSQA